MVPLPILVDKLFCISCANVQVFDAKHIEALPVPRIKQRFLMLNLGVIFDLVPSSTTYLGSCDSRRRSICAHRENTGNMTGPQIPEIPRASVQRWNANIVSIACPFCQKIQTHGFGGSYTSIVRASHCKSSSLLSYPSYQFHYPFSTSNKSVSYEIDKVGGCYVAIAAEASCPTKKASKRS